MCSIFVAAPFGRSTRRSGLRTWEEKCSARTEEEEAAFPRRPCAPARAASAGAAARPLRAGSGGPRAAGDGARSRFRELRSVGKRRETALSGSGLGGHGRRQERPRHKWPRAFRKPGAGNGTRTRDPQLGKRIRRPSRHVPGCPQTSTDRRVTPSPSVHARPPKSTDFHPRGYTGATSPLSVTRPVSHTARGGLSRYDANAPRSVRFGCLKRLPRRSGASRAALWLWATPSSCASPPGPAGPPSRWGRRRNLQAFAERLARGEKTRVNEGGCPVRCGTSPE